MDRNMRLLWLSNWCDNTGYGNQTRLFVPMLQSVGLSMAVAAFWGVEAQPARTNDGIILLPRVSHPYMNDVIDSHYRYHRADAVITLIDPFVLDERVYADLHWIAWTPIDGEPILPATAQVLRSARRVWAMSRFGERLLHQAGFSNVDYVPHGVDAQTFHPIDRDEARARLKQEVGLDLAKRFVVMINAANKGTPSRKGFYEAFAAFKVFSDAHPEAILYVHSEQIGLYGGEQLPTLAQMVGLAPEKILYAPQYHYVCGMLPPRYLNDCYNASDVLLHPAHGEGFGIPLVEAQMAGLPVITTDFSAMSELCFAGWKVQGLPFMPASGTLHRLPLIPPLIEALEASYQQRGDLSLRQQAQNGAQDYAADVVFERHLLPAIHKIADEIDAKRSRREQRTALHEVTRQ
ncbi:MAG: glycosyltransferase [Anaerolineae bacterium]